MKRFEYISSKDCANEQKRREFNARINNGELAIRGIVKAGTDYRIAITIFDDHAKTVTPTECKEMAIKLSSICNEDISLVEIELAQKKKAIYLAHANCLRIVENGFKTYENDNGNISKILIPLGRDIYKYYKT